PYHVDRHREAVTQSRGRFPRPERIHENLARDRGTPRGDEALEELSRLSRAPLGPGAADRDYLEYAQDTHLRAMHRPQGEAGEAARLAGSAGFRHERMRRDVGDVMPEPEIGQLDLCLRVPCERSDPQRRLDRQFEMAARVIEESEPFL